MLPTSSAAGAPLRQPLLEPPAGGLAAQVSPDQIEAFEASRFHRAVAVGRRIGGVGMPAVHWAAGALGASIVAATVALGNNKGASQEEVAAGASVVVGGVGMYLSGVENVLAAARACPRGTPLVDGALALAAPAVLLTGGALVGTADPSRRLAGAATYAFGVHGVAVVLGIAFALGRDDGGRRHVDRITLALAALFALGGLTVAGAVTTGIVWKLGTFGFSGAWIVAAGGGAHVLLTCCATLAGVLFAQYRAQEAGVAGPPEAAAEV